MILRKLLKKLEIIEYYNISFVARYSDNSHVYNDKAR